VAGANEEPKLNLQAGATALDEDIPRVLKVLGASSLEEIGWSRPNRLSLLVPMTGIYQGQKDDFLLRLGFEAYREWPPSARFVNPGSLDYAYPDDQHFVPKLVSQECQTHVAYQRTPQSNKIQLICCSATLEFYQALHGVEADHIWKNTDTFFTTITAIQKALGSSYQGRF
jgi:hypothetical protein